MQLLEAALRYTKAGIAAIPLWNDARKNPRLTYYSEFYKRLPTAEQWTRWARLWPNANVGLITGYWGLVALDFDDHQSYHTWCKTSGMMGITWTVATARGCHVWFRVGDPGVSRNYVHPNGQSVLLRARGGYCIVPPSVHHTGARYTTVNNSPPLRVDSVDFLAGWGLRKQKKSKQNTIKPLDLYRTGHDQIRIEDLIPIPDSAKPNGRGAYQVICPFHDDGNPSAWVNPEQQRFGCNVCLPGFWWDVINVYAKVKGISNGGAYKIINYEK